VSDCNLSYSLVFYEHGIEDDHIPLTRREATGIRHGRRGTEASLSMKQSRSISRFMNTTERWSKKAFARLMRVKWSNIKRWWVRQPVGPGNQEHANCGYCGSRRASAQLEAAYDFVPEENVSAAEKQLDIIKRAVEQLAISGDGPPWSSLRHARVGHTKHSIYCCVPFEGFDRGDSCFASWRSTLARSDEAD